MSRKKGGTLKTLQKSLCWQLPKCCNKKEPTDCRQNAFSVWNLIMKMESCTLNKVQFLTRAIITVRHFEPKSPAAKYCDRMVSTMRSISRSLRLKWPRSGWLETDEVKHKTMLRSKQMKFFHFENICHDWKRRVKTKCPLIESFGVSWRASAEHVKKNEFHVVTGIKNKYVVAIVAKRSHGNKEF